LVVDLLQNCLFSDPMPVINNLTRTETLSVLPFIGRFFWGPVRAGRVWKTSTTGKITKLAGNSSATVRHPKRTPFFFVFYGKGRFKALADTCAR
jgi:hypothetical protein